jgi:hypothetical protein
MWFKNVKNLPKNTTFGNCFSLMCHQERGSWCATRNMGNLLNKDNFSRVTNVHEDYSKDVPTPNMLMWSSSYSLGPSTLYF